MKLVQWVVDSLRSMLTKEYIEVSEYASVSMLIIQQLFLVEMDSLNAKNFSDNQCPIIRKYSKYTHVVLNEAIYHGLERILNRVKSFEDLVINAQSFLYLILKLEANNPNLVEFRQKFEKVLNDAPKMGSTYELPAVQGEPKLLLLSHEIRDSRELIDDKALDQAAGAQPASRDKKKAKK